jgi:hypothetical protein
MAYCASLRWLWWWRNWWNDWQGNPKYSEKTCHSAALSTTNPSCCPNMNRGRRGGKPASNRLSYGTAKHTENYTHHLLSHKRNSSIIPQTFVNPGHLTSISGTDRLYFDLRVFALRVFMYAQFYFRAFCPRIYMICSALHSESFRRPSWAPAPNTITLGTVFQR